MKLNTMYSILITGLFCFIMIPAQQELETDKKNLTITIWIHGTKLTPTIAFSNFFYRMPGLHGAQTYDKKYHKRAIADLLCLIAPEEFSLEDFYFFGWNGKLCFKERENASKDFYIAALNLISDYESIHHIRPKIRIITHSHGANVILHLAEIQNPEQPLFIDEIIMLGAPVQERTKHLIAHDCFGKIYAFYSGTDIFQIIDPQGLYKESKSTKTFSERTFNHHDKLRQVKVKVNSKSLMHIDFLLLTFLKYLPTLCKEIDHLYDIIVPSQITYEKTFDIRTNKDDSFYIHKKLQP